MDKKLNISRWLMYLSLLLIVLFQAYWLRKVYSDSFFNLRREISVVLRESFVREQIQTLLGDSSKMVYRADNVTMGSNKVTIVNMANDSAPKNTGWNGRDTVHFNFSMPKKNDSANQHGQMPRVMTFDGRGEQEELKSLIVTLPASEALFSQGKLKEQYRGILQKANLPHDFEVKKSERQFGDVGRRMGMPLMPTMVTPQSEGNRLLLVDLDFGKPVSHILGKMYGQIAISLLMTSLIIIAFRFMYRSLLQQQRLSAQKDEFISNMTHELKTPVATVSVAIEALKNFSAMDNPARTREYLDISAAELNRLSLLIDKVLRINMFEADRLNLDAEPLDLRMLTTEVIQAQQIQAEKLHAILLWEAPEEPVMVKGDKLHLMSVLYNLLDNAMKYRNGQPEVTLGLKRVGREAIWTVQDNGPGIAAEYLGKVFEKFFRVPHGDRHDVKGYGLGLSYVREVVQKHGGTIDVTSEPGKGCTFTVRLPALD